MKKIILIISVLLFSAALIIGGLSYFYFFRDNVSQNASGKYLFIKTDAGFESVMGELREGNFLKDTSSFIWLARRLNYPNNIVPGRYLINKGMNNKELVYMLKAGKQKPLNLVLRSSGNQKQLASFLGKNLEPDSVVFYNLLNDNQFLSKYGFDSLTSIALFIPDTYNYYWNTNHNKVFDKFFDSYKKFWNESRTKKAEALGLKPLEVSILASIVEKETAKVDEMPVVAGVYLNRLKINKKLEADPTVLFAVDNPEIKRVKGHHLRIDSPFNTYMYAGLPPGPICIPSKQAIDAVLNRENHNFIYFCAKEDFSGYHNFAVTFEQHCVNARKYQKEMDRRGY